MWLRSWIGIHTVTWNVILPSDAWLYLANCQCVLSEDKSAIYHQSAKPKALLLNWISPMIKSHTQDAPSVEHVIWLDDNNTPMPPLPKANTKPCSHKPAMRLRVWRFWWKHHCLTFLYQRYNRQSQGVFLAIVKSSYLVVALLLCA